MKIQSVEGVFFRVIKEKEKKVSTFFFFFFFRFIVEGKWRVSKWGLIGFNLMAKSFESP